MSLLQEISNVTSDFESVAFYTPIDTHFGITIIHEGMGYMFDAIIEVSNDISDNAYWGERGDSALIDILPTDTPVVIDFQSGMSAARIKFYNVTGTITNIKIDIHRTLL